MLDEFHATAEGPLTKRTARESMNWRDEECSRAQHLSSTGRRPNNAASSTIFAPFRVSHSLNILGAIAARFRSHTVYECSALSGSPCSYRTPLLLSDRL